jgi:hypothetical protein
MQGPRDPSSAAGTAGALGRMCWALKIDWMDAMTGQERSGVRRGVAGSRIVAQPPDVARAR